jgi:hypothetical protein
MTNPRRSDRNMVTIPPLLARESKATRIAWTPHHDNEHRPERGRRRRERAIEP